MVAAVGLAGSSAATEPALAATGIERIVATSASDVTWIEEQRVPTDDDLALAIGLGAKQ
jgi:hypothetical protein